MNMPFGKYKDQPVRDLPSGYLQWALDNLTHVEPELRSAIEWEASRRGLREQPKESRLRGGLRPDEVESVLRRWYREMAREFHPDCGGSCEAMKAISRANDRLREMLADSGFLSDRP